MLTICYKCSSKTMKETIIKGKRLVVHRTGQINQLENGFEEITQYKTL